MAAKNHIFYVETFPLNKKFDLSDAQPHFAFHARAWACFQVASLSLSLSLSLSYSLLSLGEIFYLVWRCTLLVLYSIFLGFSP